MTHQEVDDKIVAWHNDDKFHGNVCEYLGWTFDQYKTYIETGVIPMKFETIALKTDNVQVTLDNISAVQMRLDSIVNRLKSGKVDNDLADDLVEAYNKLQLAAISLTKDQSQ